MRLRNLKWLEGREVEEMVEEKSGARNGEQERNRKEVDDEVEKIMKETDKEVYQKVTETMISIFVFFLMSILASLILFIGVAWITLCAKVSCDIVTYIWGLW